MAQYGKNNYFDGVILPEPKEEMLRRMAKGVDASKGYLESTDAGLLFDGPRSMECFFNLRQSDGTQRPAQFSTSMLAIAVTPMDAIMFHCGNKSLQVSRATIGDDIHAVISYDGATAMCYINGIEVGAMQPTAYTPSALFRIGDPLHITKSPVHFCRHFNYALSAEEVAAHYNNGDPMGYVVPKAMRRPEIAFPSGVYTESSRTFSQNNTQSTTATYNNPQANGFSGSYIRFDAVTTVSLYNAFWSNILKRAYPIKVTMEYRCNYDLYEGNTVQASGRMLATANDGDAKVVAIYYPNSLGNANLGIGNNNAPDAWLEIRVNSITSVGLLAEYLPQNLIPTAESSVVQWLDSAPQLPEANGILPPLDASVGGYDLAAIGNPKIVV